MILFSARLKTHLLSIFPHTHLGSCKLLSGHSLAAYLFIIFKETPSFTWRSIFQPFNHFHGSSLDTLQTFKSPLHLFDREN